MNQLRSIQSMSPNPHTKVGCMIYDKMSHIKAVGYNHPCFNFDPNTFWEMDREVIRSFILHAEAEAIANWQEKYFEQPTGAIVTLLPCSYCMNLLIRSGIKEIYYFDELDRDQSTKQLAKLANIELIKLDDNGLSVGVI